MGYVQIGVTALRAPNGEFLPSVPLYIDQADAEKVNPFPCKENQRSYEDYVIDDIAKKFAKKFGEYTERIKKAKKSQEVKIENDEANNKA